MREELKKELGKAKANKVQHLIFATNAQLRIGKDVNGDEKFKSHVGELEKLNEDKKYVENLFIWPRANLEILINRWPWLKHNYFGNPQYPAFVPPQVYFEGYEKGLLPNPLIGRENDIEKVVDFAASPGKKIFLLHGEGGAGKSHFLWAAAEKINASDTNYQIWFYRPLRSPAEAIGEELNESLSYLIVVDDAERYQDDVRLLIEYARLSSGRIKLLLTSRTAGKELVENSIEDQKIFEYDELALGKLSEQNLFDLLTASLGGKSVEHPERIIRELNNNPFLIVMMGKLIKGGEIDPKTLKKQLRANLEKDALSALRGVLEDIQVKHLLLELSAIVPIQPNSKVVLETLSDKLDVKKDVIEDAIDKLIETNVLRKIGSTLRFNPDMVGDIYLATELDEADGDKTTNELFSEWLDVIPEQVATNLAAAARHRENGSAYKVIQDFVSSLVTDTAQTSHAQKKKNLAIIQRFVFLAPNESLDLINAYLDSEETLSRDDYGPIVAALLHIPDFQKKMFDFIVLMIQKEIKGTYSNYEPKGLMKDIASPIEVGLPIAREAIKIFTGIIKQDDCTLEQVALISLAISEALSGSHEYSESYANTLTVGRRTLVLTPQVEEFRNMAMITLESLIKNKNLSFRIYAIDVIENIGHEAQSSSGDLWNRIIQDKSQALDWLREVLSDATYYFINRAEHLLIRIWANNDVYPELSIKAATILRAIPRPPEYLMYSQYVSSDLVIKDFTKLESEAPETGRWHWLVYNRFRHEIKEEDIEDTVKIIAGKYSTEEEVVKFLFELNGMIGDKVNWAYVPMIEVWANYNADCFTKIVLENRINIIPALFHEGFYSATIKRHPEYLEAYGKQLIAEAHPLEVKEVMHFLSMIIQTNPPFSRFFPSLVEITKKSTPNAKATILHKSFFIFGRLEASEKKKVLDILAAALDGEITPGIFDMFSFLFTHAIAWNLDPAELKKFNLKLFDILKGAPIITYDIDEILRGVVVGDAKMFVDFLNYRIEKSEAEKKSPFEFRAIPHEGFGRTLEEFTRYEDFEIILDCVLTWKDRSGFHQFDIENILGHLSSQTSSEHGNYLNHYINKKITDNSKQSLNQAITALYALPLSEDSYATILKIWDAGKKLGLDEKVKSLISHKVISGAFSGQVGEAPPALVNKKDLLLKLKEITPAGTLRNHIDALIKQVEFDIQRWTDGASRY